VLRGASFTGARTDSTNFARTDLSNAQVKRVGS